MTDIICLKPEEKINLYCDHLFDGEEFSSGEGFFLSLEGNELLKISHEGAGLKGRKSPEGKAWAWPYKTTVLPAMIDCHLHLALGRNSKNTQKALPREEILHQFESLLQGGVVAARDGGDFYFQGWRGALLSQRQRRNKIPAPYIEPTGRAIFKKGYYGSFLGEGISTPREAYHVLDIFARRGIKQAKVLFSGIVSFDALGKVGKQPFTLTEASALVEKAHSLGMRVMAHASSDEGVRLAINAGADSIEHGYFVNDATLEEMAARKIPWIPTLAPVALLVEEEKSFSFKQRKIIKATWERQAEKVLLASRLGVPLAVGTDAGAPGVAPGAGYIQELKLLAQAGLTNKMVLRGATSQGAKVLGMQDEFGYVKEGKRCCLMVVRGNPLEDLTSLLEPLLVISPPCS